MLPYVGSGTPYSLIVKSESWDSETNRTSVSGKFSAYLCPSNTDAWPVSDPGVSSYVGIAGVGTNAAELAVTDPNAGPFGYDRRVKMGDFKRGWAVTAVVAETAVSNGPWIAGGPSTVRGLDPGYIPYCGKSGQFSSYHHSDGSLWILSVNYSYATNVLFADGSVRSFAKSIDPKVFEAQATLSGGEADVNDR
jgi:prepilin-type processing-associated H-X9-DG protein